MIKVLHVVSSLGGGGVEKMLYNYYKNIDRKTIQFDFVVHGSKEGILEEKLRNMGSNIYHVSPKKVSFIKNFLEIQRTIKNGDYNIVEVHQNFSSFSALFAAWLCGVKIRLIHSHGCDNRKKLSLDKYILRGLNAIFATGFLACSSGASKWLYGSENKGKIIYNAVDYETFAYNGGTRKMYRERLGIKDTDVCLLQVGRFSDEKNHKFTLEIMKNLKDKKYKLLFAGDGKKENELKKMVEEFNLEEQVCFLGCVDYVPELMCAADILLLPSLHEGLPVVTIEAQSSGLLLFVSDELTREIKISDNIKFLPLENEIWIEEIKAYSNDICRNSIKCEKYCIKIQGKKYSEYLQKLVEKK